MEWQSSAKRCLYCSNRKQRFCTDTEDGAVEVDIKLRQVAGFFVCGMVVRFVYE